MHEIREDDNWCIICGVPIPGIPERGNQYCWDCNNILEGYKHYQDLEDEEEENDFDL